MLYQINKENYHRFEVLAMGRLPERSYFIPFSTREKADAVILKEKRYRSDKVTCLSGQWDFRFFPIPKELPDVLDTETLGFGTIDVPSCWQFRGYDRPFYVNMRYQFPYAPPKIPQEDPVGKVFYWKGTAQGIRLYRQTPKDEYNFVGVYRKKFLLRNAKKRHILSFLGVSSCVDVYLNGQFVGYSEGSHNTAEFDITHYQIDGENELLCVVHRWCTGSYLECQDMFRNNGIFRDVLLYEMDGNDIWDVSFEAKKTDRGYTAIISAYVYGTGEVEITLNGYGSKRSAVSNGVAKVEFCNLDVQEWNAEDPKLYDLYFQMDNTCIKLRVGFRDIQIRGDVYTLNGTKVKLHGVNHHDVSCDNGFCMTSDEIELDVCLCKKYNIDTIRTSHYPPDPLLLELCDELGVYVVDEADLETHGVYAHQFPPTFNSLTQDKRWEGRYMERVKRLYHRDKNHVSVVMWSLGNESGGYRNTDAMYTYLKARSSVPVQYEGAIHSRRKAYDVCSEMYPTIEHLASVGQKKCSVKRMKNRPYFMCEYAYAMGTAPGAMEEYWQQIYQYDNLMGGCVWEMADHAVRHPDGSFTYGGDHGEWEHDSNFCVNGIFYPDRKPSTGANVVRFVYRPIRVRHITGNTYEIFNTRSFTNAHRYILRFCFSDGRTLEHCVSVPPMCRQRVPLPGCEASGNSVTVITLLDEKEVSREQIIFQIPVRAKPKRLLSLPANLDVRDGVVTITKDGKCLCSANPYTILFRAPIDNDTDWRMQSVMDDFIGQSEEVIETKAQPDKITVKTKITCKKQVFECLDIYESCEEGTLVTSTLHCIKGKGKLPRFGKAFRLDETFKYVQYIGRNAESYCDMKHQAQIERVSCTVHEMTEPNIRPQESGNRCDCTEVTVSDDQCRFRFIAVGKPFELGVKPYSDRELLTMRHNEDEHTTGTYVTLSAFQMGVGTGACGPATRPEYCYDMRKDYTLQFIIA